MCSSPAEWHPGTDVSLDSTIRMIICIIIYHTYDWSRPYDHTPYAVTGEKSVVVVMVQNNTKVLFQVDLLWLILSMPTAC